jgi:AraC-like DNA-binding protein
MKLMQFDNPPFCIRILHSDEQTMEEHNQQDYEIIWIKTGAGVHIIDQVECPISYNTVFFATPGQQHQLILDPNSEGYIISFSEIFVSHREDDFDSVCDEVLLTRFSQSTGIHVQENLEKEMTDIVRGMMREYGQTEMQKRYLQIFLIYITRQFSYVPPQVVKRNHSLAKKFVSLLETGFREKRTVNEYARVLSVSPSYLNEIVKRESGYSAGHHIRTRIIHEAKRRAIRSDASMKEIAWYLGFNDIAHFSKLFKNMTGSSFTTFRKQVSL